MRPTRLALRAGPLFLAAATPLAAAEVRLAPLFSDHAVLQRDAPIRVFGSAERGERVELTLSAGSDLVARASTVADAEGRWLAALAPCSARGPLELRANREVRTVWMGEVWICAGQSNMEWPLAWAGDPKRELAAAGSPHLRLFTVPRRSADVPQSELADGTDIEDQPLAVGGWRACTPETARLFSAVGYHFGRGLADELDVPVGLIQCAWGGTLAEAWTPPRSFAADPSLAPVPAPELLEQNAPSVLYNGMLAPLERFQVAGVIWYQGESNVGAAGRYRRLFPALIEGWREALGKEDLPFLFVQLAAFMERQSEPGESAWAELREAQAQALTLAHTGMAVAIDIGEAADIHPKNKREVGRRLALLALRDVYGRPELAASGPTLAGVEFAGALARVRFDHGAGLRTAGSGGPVQGFELGGEDGRFFWAAGRIEGETVVLESSAVPHPVQVRYAWADNPAANLVNAAGLPAAPFRSASYPVKSP